MPVASGLRIGLAIAASIVVVDQIVKSAIRSRLELHESVQVIPDFLNLTRVHNYGAAFGLLNAADLPFKAVLLALIAAVSLGALAWYGLTLPEEQRLARIGLALIVAGAAGNLIDRVRFGYVVDFVDAYWRGWHFWAFNVADAAITIGVSLMILDLLGTGRRRVSRAV
jgi:signal peptidase II